MNSLLQEPLLLMCSYYDPFAIAVLIFAAERLAEYSIVHSRLRISFAGMVLVCAIVLGLEKVACASIPFFPYARHTVLFSLLFFFGFYFLKKGLVWFSNRYDEP